MGQCGPPGRDLRPLPAGLGDRSGVEVLPYHSTGAVEEAQLGPAYPRQGVPAPKGEQVGRVRHVFRAEGLTTY